MAVPFLLIHLVICFITLFAETASHEETRLILAILLSVFSQGLAQWKMENGIFHMSSKEKELTLSFIFLNEHQCQIPPTLQKSQFG